MNLFHRRFVLSALGACLSVGFVLGEGSATAAPPVSGKDRPWTARVSGIDPDFRIVGLIVNSKTGGQPVVDWGDGTVERVQKCLGLKSDPVCSVGVMHQYKTGGTWSITVRWKGKTDIVKALVPTAGE